MSFSRRLFRASNSTPSTTPPGPSDPVAFSTATGRAIPDTLYGVTTEYITQLSDLSMSLSRHTKRPCIRIVFQPGMSASEYSSAVSTMRNSSYIFGQLYDSTAFQEASISQIQQKTRNFLDTFGENIDIYEIGNELNGEWVGSSQSEIDSKVIAIYDVIKNEYSSLKIRTAITLNYWPNSNYYAQSWENTETYAANMPAKLRSGADYLLLSFYETAGNPIYYPTNQDFVSILTKMANNFPNAKVGIGEIGAQGAVDGLPRDPTLADKQRIANRYYGMHNDVKNLLGSIGNRYIGGYFWWYYFQDCVPYNKSGSLWPTLESNFNNYS